MTYYMRTRIAFAGDWGNQAVPRLGNMMGGAPTGLYSCAGGGPNDFAYLITVTDRHWDCLCVAIGRPELAIDPRFDTGDKRALNDAPLREEISSWTREHEKYEVMRVLGDAGVPCSAIIDTSDLYRDPHLVARDFVKRVEHRDLGEVSLLGFPTRMSGSEVPIQAAPLLGEHNDEVLREDLELSDDEIAALRRDGILAREP
jgi:formyl-CoA transferase